MRCATAMLGGGLPLQLREVELADRVVDQLPVRGRVERARGHLLGGDEREVGDLAADLGERTLRLRLDLPPRLLHAPRAVLLGLVPHALALRLADAAGLAQDLLGLAARLSDQRAVLLEQPARLAAGVVRL